uniref:MYND-type domain-containing protein n=1 Tax=Oryzias latipes TaxID=8090 RepID=A0A3P9KZJ6_ORYLA
MEDRPLVLGQTCKATPLAFPKGRKKVCELCQSPARLQCAMSRVTFYCHAENQRADWVAIHERICKLFVPIPIVVYFHELFCLELIEICTLVAQSKLFEGKHQEALPTALLCLRYTEDVRGPQSVHQAHAFLLLAEANIGLGNLALAAELLSQAEWVLLETPECRNSLLQRLNRNFGCLHAATGNLEDARFYFANDVNILYFALVGCYNSKANFDFVNLIIFFLFYRVARIWYDHLTKLLEIYKKSISNSAMSWNTFHAEGEQVLGAILEFLQKDISELLAGARHDTVVELGFAALQASRLMLKRDLTDAIQALLQLLQTNPQPPSD